MKQALGIILGCLIVVPILILALLLLPVVYLIGVVESDDRWGEEI